MTQLAASPKRVKKRIHPLICEWCGMSFLGDKIARQFCGRSCSGKARMNTPEAKERSRTTMLRLRQRPDVQEALLRHLRSGSNPLRNPRNQAKAQVILRQMGYPTLKGGNGQGLTVPQRILADRLGWPAEYPIGVNPRQRDLPSVFKLDLAEPVLKVGIEVDGHSHMGRKVKAADARKRHYLESRGWTVLHFWNKQILEDLPEVINQIQKAVQSLTSKPRPATTLPKACWSTIPIASRVPEA